MSPSLWREPGESFAAGEGCCRAPGTPGPQQRARACHLLGCTAPHPQNTDLGMEGHFKEIFVIQTFS